jgi:predicted RNase H-like nuclease
MNTTLIVGFDSAWSLNNSGGIVGVFVTENGENISLGDPTVVNQEDAACLIKAWQKAHRAKSTLILIDQPTIVPNMHGQRPVENIIGSPISRRYGGVQPSNRSKKELFGDNAPIWEFLKEFDGACNPIQSFSSQHRNNNVIETYPALAMIAMGWLPDDNHIYPRETGRLPKYNPDNRRNFSYDDWRFVCHQTALGIGSLGLSRLEKWLTNVENNESPRKQDQDCLDACICLLIGMHLVREKDCLFVGDMVAGYMVVPYGVTLHKELVVRCEITGRKPVEWLHKFKMSC